MLTKNAIGNLKNRYKAVLKKCHLLNTFGSLAVVGTLVAGSIVGGVGVAAAENVEFSGSITNIIVGGTDPTAAPNANAALGSNIDTADTATGTNNTITIGAENITLGEVFIGGYYFTDSFKVSTKAGDAGVDTFSSDELTIFSYNDNNSASTYEVVAGTTHNVIGNITLDANNSGTAALSVLGTVNVQGNITLDANNSGTAVLSVLGTVNVHGDELSISGTAGKGEKQTIIVGDTGAFFILETTEGTKVALSMTDVAFNTENALTLNANIEGRNLNLAGADDQLITVDGNISTIGGENTFTHVAFAEGASGNISVTGGNATVDNVAYTDNTTFEQKIDANDITVTGGKAFDYDEENSKDGGNATLTLSDGGSAKSLTLANGEGILAAGGTATLNVGDDFTVGSVQSAGTLKDSRYSVVNVTAGTLDLSNASLNADENANTLLGDYILSTTSTLKVNDLTIEGSKLRNTGTGASGEIIFGDAAGAKLDVDGTLILSGGVGAGSVSAANVKVATKNLNIGDGLTLEAGIFTFDTDGGTISGAAENTDLTIDGSTVNVGVNEGSDTVNVTFNTALTHSNGFLNVNVGDSLTATDGAAYSDATDVFVNIAGTLDLSKAAVNKDGIEDVLAGKYTLGDTGSDDLSMLVVENLTIGALALTADPAGAGEISFGENYANGMLVVEDTLTITDDYDGNSFAGNIMTTTLKNEAANFTAGTLIFSSNDTVADNITQNLSISNAAAMTVGVADTDLASGTTTLAADKILNITATNGLEVLKGATLDVTKGTLTVDDGKEGTSGFSDESFGTIKIDHANIGLNETTLVYNGDANSLYEKYTGELMVTGIAEGTFITLEDYSTLKEKYIIGNNATLNLLNVKFLNDLVLDKLTIGTAAVDSEVSIGTGEVSNGGTMTAGTVLGDGKTSIVITNNSTLNITGEANEGALFFNHVTGTVKVEEGTLNLGNANTASTLATGVALGDSTANTIGALNIVGDVDMGANIIDSLGTGINTVSVTSGTLSAGFDLDANDNLNVIATTTAATATASGTLGNINIKGGHTNMSSATVNVNTVGVTALGDVNLTSQASSAILDVNASGTTAADLTVLGALTSDAYSEINVIGGDLEGENATLTLKKGGEIAGKVLVQSGTAGDAALNLAGGNFTIDSVDLKKGENDNGALKLSVTDGSEVSIGSLSATFGVVNVENASVKVIDSYGSNHAEITIGSGGTLDLSNIYVNPSDITGTHFIDGGTLNIGNLTIDSSNLVGTDDIGDVMDAQIGFDHTNGGTLITDTLTFSDDEGMIEFDQTKMTIQTKTLAAPSLTDANYAVVLGAGQDMVFSGGGAIQTNLTADGGQVVIGLDEGEDGTATPAVTTTLAADKILNIVTADGLYVKEGNHLNALGTLKVADGGFNVDGTGQLTVKAAAFGKFTVDEVTKAITQDDTDATVHDKYFGDLVINGVGDVANPTKITLDSYNKFLVGGSSALIEGTNSTLLFEGTTLDLTGKTLDNLQGGTNTGGQGINIGTGLANSGGKVTTDHLIQDMSVPKSLVISDGTTVQLQGQTVGVAAHEGDVVVQSDSGFETGVTGAGGLAKQAAVVTGAITLAEGSSGYVAHSDSTIQGGIVEATGSNNSGAIEVKAGATLSIGTFSARESINTPRADLKLETGSTVFANNITVDKLNVVNSIIDAEGTFTAQGGSVSGSVSAQELALSNVTFFGTEEYSAHVDVGSSTIDGFIISDPLFDGAEPYTTLADANASILNLGEVTFGTGASVGLIAAQNSLIATGKNSDSAQTDLQHAIDKGIITWGSGTNADGTRTANTSAALGVYSTLQMGDNSGTGNTTLLVDGDYYTEGAGAAQVLKDSNGVTVLDSTGIVGGGLATNTAYFGANSLLIIDASESGIDMTDANHVAINGVAGATNTELKVYNDATTDTADARIHIVGGQAGKLRVLNNFNVDGNTITTALWDANAITTTTDALTVFDIASTINGEVVISLTADAKAALPMLRDEIADYYNTNILGVDGSGLDTSLSAEAGQYFLSSAIERVNVEALGAKRMVATIEGAAMMGALGGVGKGAMESAMAMGDVIIEHSSLIGSSTQDGNTGSVTMNNDEITTEVGINGGSMAEKAGIGVWLAPLYEWNTGSGFKGGSLEHDYDMGLGGIALGVDFTNTIGAESAYRIGLAMNVGGGYSDSTGDFNETNNDFDFWGISAYSAFQKENFVGTLDFGFTSTANELTQNLPVTMGMGNLNADVDAFAFSAGLNLEYTFNTSFMDITPHVGVRFMSVTTEKYDIDSSLGRVASVDEDTQNVWYLPVGVTFNTDIESSNGWKVTPKLDLGFIVSAGDLDANSNAKFTGVPGTLESSLENVDSFAFNGGLGFELVNEESDISIGLNYNLTAGEKDTSHKIFASFRYEF